MERKYLPIKSTSLAHYFGSACIMPSKYIENKPPDVQDKYDNSLLVSSKVGTKDADCCLELIILDDEIAEMKELDNNFALLNTPLPISRVRRIIFSDKQVMKQALTNIKLSTAFIPSSLVEYKGAWSTVNVSDVCIKQKTKDWSAELKKYNSFLGGFAMMNIAREDNANYARYYFSTLSLFNDVIKNELNVSNRKIDTRFSDAFYGRDSFKELHPYINKIINEGDVNSIAKAENQIIKKDNITKRINTDSLDKASYIVAILNTYGVGTESKRGKIDSLILSNFKNGIKVDKKEVVALCYGLNRGYSVFSNKYKNKAHSIDVKFQLDSQLDYYTIEALYYAAFFNKKTDAFPYIDDWCPKFKEHQKKSAYQALDKGIVDDIIVDKKQDEVEEDNKSASIKVLSREYLTSILYKHFKNEAQSFFKDFVCQIRTQVYNDTVAELKTETDKILISENIKKETIPTQSKSNDLSSSRKKELVLKTFEYNKKNVKSLQKEAKERGLNIKGLKKEDLIVVLISNETKQAPKLNI